MDPKYCIVSGAGDIWTIGCPKCADRFRQLKKNLHFDPSGDWIMLHPHTCSCGFSSQRIASLLESTEIKKTMPPPKQLEKDELLFYGVLAAGALFAFASCIWNSGEQTMKSQAADAAQRAAEQRSYFLAAIVNHEVKVGMTMDQVESAWGRPVSKAHTQNATNTADTWYFGGGRFVLFRNEEVVSVTAP